MQRMSTSKRTVLALLAIYLLCASTAAIATITPLAEVQDEYYYNADFGDTGFVISIPVRYKQHGMIINDADIKQLLFMEEDDGKPCFTITGIRNESFAGMHVAELSWADLLPAFEPIMEGAQEEPLLMPMEASAEALETMAVLFPGDEGTWHVAGLREDWLLVLTLHPQDGDEATIELARGKMEDLAYRMLTPSFDFDIVEQIVPENSSICITLPEGMEALVDPYDEYGKTVYYLRESANPNITSFIYVTTAFREEYVGKTIEQLPGDQLNDAAGIVFVGFGEAGNGWLPLDGKPGLWITEETSPGYGFSHLLYIKDGWLVGVTTVHLNEETEMPLEEMTTIQLSIIQNLIRGSDEPASRQPESIALQGETGAFQISIPPGHLMYQRAKGKEYIDCVIINVLNARESYLVLIMQQENPQLTGMLDRPDDLAAFTEDLESIMMSSLSTPELVEEGILGEATLLFYTGAKESAMAVTYVDGFSVVLGINAPDILENSKAVIDIGNRFVSFTAGD